MKKIIKINALKLIKNKPKKIMMEKSLNKKIYKISNKKNKSFSIKPDNSYYNQIYKKKNKLVNNNFEFKDLTVYKRAISINKLIKFIIDNNYCLNEYTFFRSILIFDKFLQTQNLNNNFDWYLKTCLFLANKLENPIKLNIQNIKIDSETIKKYEKLILYKLNFKINDKTLLDYWDYFLFHIYQNKYITKENLIKLKFKSILVLRIIILNPDLLKYKPQTIAITSIIYNINKIDNWNKKLIKNLLKLVNDVNQVIKFKKLLNEKYNKFIESFDHYKYIFTKPNLNNNSLYN